METSIALPNPLPDDPEVVATALETASIFGVQGDAREAVRWVRRAAELAGDAGADDRAFALARAAADLVANLQPVAAPSAPPVAAAPSAPPVAAAPAAPVGAAPSAPPIVAAQVAPAAAAPVAPAPVAAAPAMPSAPPAPAFAAEAPIAAGGPPPPPPPPPVIPGPARGSRPPGASSESVSVSPIVPLGSSTPNFSGNATLPLHSTAPVVSAPVATIPMAAAPVAPAPIAAAPAPQAPIAQPVVAQAPIAQAPVTQQMAPQAPVVSAGYAGNGSGSNGNGSATAETAANFQRLARAFHEGADVQPAPVAAPPPLNAVYEPVPAQPSFSDEAPFPTGNGAPAAAPLDMLLRDAARTAARASIEASQEEGVYIVRLLKSDEGAPDGAHEALVVLVDPNSDLFDAG